ncbi:MAG: prepilin-type N-terminal cleavage/methylation domain-containing protein [Candidatus Magasanikbacteria bacterium]
MNRKAFTLIEVLVAVGIFTLVITSMISLLSYSFKSKDIIWEQLSTQNEGRKIVQDFVNELRTATQSSIGAYAIESVGTSSIVFYSNIDEDSWRERVHYFLMDKILKKGITKPSGNPLTYDLASETVSEAVHDIANTSTPIFYFYGENYDGVSNTSTLPSPVAVTAVRVVGIKLVLEEDPRLSPAPLQIEGKVEVRNLKTN